MYYIDTKDEADNTIHKGGTTYDINSATKYEQGSILPKVFGGFGTNLRVGNFDLSLTFDYQIGGKVYDVTLRLADVALVGSRLRQRHPQGLGEVVEPEQYRQRHPALAAGRPVHHGQVGPLPDRRLVPTSSRSPSAIRFRSGYSTTS